MKNTTIYLAHFILFFVVFLQKNLQAQNSGNTYFASSQIHTIKITSPLTVEQLYDSLSYYKDQANQTDDNTYMKVDVEIDGVTVQEIGIRMKGNSSYNINSKKKSLKLSFDEYVNDQEYDGMGTLNLNNCMWDPTLMREKVTLDFMRDFGVYAPRCTYANVYLNNVLWGLYSTVEQVDKKFLNTRLGENDGNLFKAGDDGGEFTWYGSNQVDYETEFELKTNDSLNDWSDLINFIDVLNNTSSNFETELEKTFNVDAFLKYWAVCNILTNLDSYLESTRNYYIYHNLLTDQFDWIAWDVNEAFGVYGMGNVYEYEWDKTNGRILLDKLLTVSSYRTSYTDYLYDLTSDYLSSGWLNNKIDSVYAVIKTSVYADTLKMFTNQNFEDNIDDKVMVSMGMTKEIPGLKEFISKRADNMNQQLMALGYPSGIENSHTSVKIGIYPNPANDYAWLQVDHSGNFMYSFELYDVLGRTIHSQLFRQPLTAIGLEDVPTGIYSYRITNNSEELKVGKIIINK